MQLGFELSTDTLKKANTIAIGRLAKHDLSNPIPHICQTVIRSKKVFRYIPDPLMDQKANGRQTFQKMKATKERSGSKNEFSLKIICKGFYHDEVIYIRR